MIKLQKENKFQIGDIIQSDMIRYVVTDVLDGSRIAYAYLDVNGASASFVKHYVESMAAPLKASSKHFDLVYRYGQDS